MNTQRTGDRLPEARGVEAVVYRQRPASHRFPDPDSQRLREGWNGRAARHRLDFRVHAYIALACLDRRVPGGGVDCLAGCFMGCATSVGGLECTEKPETCGPETWFCVCMAIFARISGPPTGRIRIETKPRTKDAIRQNRYFGFRSIPSVPRSIHLRIWRLQPLFSALMRYI